MKDAMIDLETFGNGVDACIVQIGACRFDRITGEIGPTLKVNVDANTSVTHGAVIDADTVYWWLGQSREAIDSITKGDKVDIISALYSLNAFLKDAEAIWSHATFDWVIVVEAMKRIGIKPSFSYRAARDIRTLVDLSGVDAKSAKYKNDLAHDALSDCLCQVKYCVDAMNRLRRMAE